MRPIVQMINLAVVLAAGGSQLLCSDFTCSYQACEIGSRIGGCITGTTGKCDGNFSFSCQGLSERLTRKRLGTQVGALSDLELRYSCQNEVPRYGSGCSTNSSGGCEGSYTPYERCSEVSLPFCTPLTIVMSGEVCYSSGGSCVAATSCSQVPSDCQDIFVGGMACAYGSDNISCVGYPMPCSSLNPVMCDTFCASKPFGLHCRWDYTNNVCGNSDAPTVSPTPRPTRPPTPPEFGATDGALTAFGATGATIAVAVLFA